ncbi:MAG: hypothetical protein HXK66_02970 [Clostridiales bacterium]|nr:hypothetical protein [Clostridiales bacterium]
MLIVGFMFVLKSVSGISLIQIRNTWITILVALTGMTILLSTVGIKVPMIQIFVTGSLRAIAYICRGIVRLIAIMPRRISESFKVIRGILTSLGMNERLSTIVTIIIIIVII